MEKEKNKLGNIGIAVLIALAVVALIQIVSYSGNYGCGRIGMMGAGYGNPISLIAGIVMFAFWGLIILSLVLFVAWIINQLNKEKEIEEIKKKKRKKK